MASQCIISDILRKSFSSRTFQEKQFIIKSGKPTDILSLEKKCKSSSKASSTVTRHFQASYYEKYEWLCGSSTLNKLFCWHCLLFSTEYNVWNKHGYSDLGNLHNAMKKHTISQGHLQSYVKCKTFGTARIDMALDKQKRDDVVKHNELVTKNREVLKILIDSVIFLGTQELAFRGHNETEASSNKGNYVELLSLIRRRDALLANHFESATVFKGTSNVIQNDLINSIATVVVDKIKEEIKSAHFVAVLADETSDIANISQLSTVFRYVDSESGIIQERFVGFSDVSTDKTASAVSGRIIGSIQEFQCGDKLVAQTYDGAAVMSGEINGVQKRIKDLYPQAIFVHCYAHILNLVLADSAKSIRECRIFFSSISGIAAFFSRSPKKTALLLEIVKKKIPRVTEVRWQYHSRLVNTIEEHRESLLTLFELILASPNDWDDKSVQAAKGFESELKDFQFIFLLKIFSEIFSFTDTLFCILQTKGNDIAYCAKKIEDITHTISEKRQGFEDFWNKVLSTREPPTSRKRTVNRSSTSAEDEYRALYFEVIDTVTQQLITRFGNWSELEFTELLDSRKFQQFTKSFPESLLNSLKESYGDYFDQVKLKNELTVAYSLSDLAQKSIHDLHNYMISNELKSGFSELYKLANLILTIPSTSASVERTFSALKRIKTYCRSTQTEQRLSALAVLSIEKNLLKEMQSSGSFYESVIANFTRTNRRMEFLYK